MNLLGAVCRATGHKKDYKNVIENYQKTKYEAAHVFTNMAYDTKTVLCHFILAG